MKIIIINYLFYICGFSIVISCTGNEVLKNESIISKNIDTSNKAVANDLTIFDCDLKEVLHFYYIDSFYYGHPLTIKQGSTKLMITSPIFLLQADNNQTPFLIYPGEHLIIKRDNEGIYFSSGENTERNKELNFFLQLIRKTNKLRDGFEPMPYQRKVGSISQLQESEITIEKKKFERVLFLKSYSDTTNLSEGFKTIALSYINHTFEKDRLVLWYNNSNTLKQQNRYYSRIDSCINNINISNSSLNISYLDLCNCAINVLSEKKFLNDFQVNSLTDFTKTFETIESKFKNQAKNFLLSLCMYYALEKKIVIPQNYLNLYYQDCTNEWYKQAIGNKISIKENGKFSTGKNILQTLNGTLKEIDSVILINRGKLILIDFWASWCSPCREELPYSAALKKEFKGQNIVFLYISTDKNPADWSRACKEESIDDDNNFLFLNADKSSFIEYHKINSIPRYILLGKDGNILAKDAPRPSDSKLKILLNK